MPAVAAPYGLRPVNLIGGRVFAGATRLMRIASGSTTAIFYGDVVTLTAAGTIGKDAGTDTATPVGVFLGCTYTDSTMGKIHRQSYPGAVIASDIQAYVVDDPNTLFQVAVVSSGTTIGTVTISAIGENAALVQNAGNSAIGNSRVAMLATTATTNTLPLRVVDVVPESTGSNPASYTEVIVKWNAGNQYNNLTGLG